MKNRVLSRTMFYHFLGITILIYPFSTGTKHLSLAPIQSLTPQPSPEELFFISKLDLITSISVLFLQFPTSRRRHSRSVLVNINIWLSICRHLTPGRVVRSDRPSQNNTPNILFFSLFTYKYKTNNRG